MTLVWKSGLNLQSPASNDPLLDLNTQPSLDLQFATGKTLNDRVSGNNLITFSRADATTCATYVDSNGVIQTAAANVPRFDHDPVTGESLGLLIEESRTNLVTHSEQLNNAAWVQISAGVPVVTPNILTAPDGTITGDLVVGNNVNTWIANNVGAVGAGQYSFSVWLKSDIAQTADIFMSYGVTDNLVCSLTTNWQRFTLTATRAATAGLFVGVNVGNAKNIYIWGAQLEANASFPTSYIPTSGSAVTRAADVADITGTNFSSWYNQSEGTVYVDFDKATTERQQAFAISDGTQVNRMSVYYSDNIAVSYIGSPAGGYDQSAYTVSSPLLSSEYILGYSSGDTKPAIDGNLGTVITEPNLPTNTTLFLGRREAGDALYMLNGHISRLAYYPYRLSDTILQEITS